MKTALMIIGGILLLGLVAAGSFWGGMAYQSSRVNSARANFEAARGQIDQAGFPGDLAFSPQGGLPGDQATGFFGGRGTTGQVKTIEGDTMTVSTAQDVTTVYLSDKTQIEKSVAGAITDLQPGTRVQVTGEQDSNGTISATRITILNEDWPVPAQPAAPGTEP
jgi:hypothetical protein